MSEGWTKVGTEPLSDSGWTKVGTEPIRTRTSGERFSQNVEDAFGRSPTPAAMRGQAGAMRQAGTAAPGMYFGAGIPGFGDPAFRLNSPVLDQALRSAPVDSEGAGRIFDPASERQRRASYEAESAADPWYRVPGFFPKIGAGLSTLGGQFAGSAMDPTSWYGPGRTAVQRMLAAGGVNAAADVAAQGADVGMKVQDKYNPYQTAAAAGLGVAIQGAGEVAGKWIKVGTERLSARAAQALERRARDAEAKSYNEAMGRQWTVDDLWDNLIRQESGGRQTAVSDKGAFGVAQLMPPTATYMANKMGRPELAAIAGQNTPEGRAANELLGRAYLQEQFDTFGDPALALAAYNAGPGRVNTWLQRFGSLDQIGRSRWVEMIPFDETRNYVRSILGRSAGPPARLTDTELKTRDTVRDEMQADWEASRRPLREAEAATDALAEAAAAAQPPRAPEQPAAPEQAIAPEPPEAPEQLVVPAPTVVTEQPRVVEGELTTDEPRTAAAPAPDPGNLWRLPLAELEAVQANTARSDFEKLVEALGSEDEAKRFEALMRAMDSMDPARAERASAEFDERYGNLTEEQGRLIYGYGEPIGLDPDSLKDVVSAARIASEVPLMDEPELRQETAFAARGLLGRSAAVQRVLSGEGSAREQAYVLRLASAMQELAARNIRMDDLALEIARVDGANQRDVDELLASLIQEIRPLTGGDPATRDNGWGATPEERIERATQVLEARGFDTRDPQVARAIQVIAEARAQLARSVADQRGDVEPPPTGLGPEDAAIAQRLYEAARDGDVEGLRYLAEAAEETAAPAVNQYAESLRDALFRRDAKPDGEFDEGAFGAPEEDYVRDVQDDVIDAVRAGKRPTAAAGRSLIDGLLKMGGLREAGGELKEILDRTTRKNFRMLRRVDGGMPLDDATMWAWENGYIGKEGGDRPEIGELLEAIRREVGGDPVYSSRADSAGRAAQEAYDDLEYLAYNAGIDLRKLSNAEVKAAIDRYVDEVYTPIDDPRDAPDDMFGVDPDQARGQLEADFDAERRRRAEGRAVGDMTEGGLFDATRRAEQPLFRDGETRTTQGAEARWKDRIAKISGAPRPSASGPALAPDAPRPKVKSVREIWTRLLGALEITRRQGRVRGRRAAGQYYLDSGEIRTRGFDELDVLTHEIGHALEYSRKLALAVMARHEPFLKTLDYDPQKARRDEGFAEWFRFYMTNPNYAHGINPALYRDFEAAMMAEAPKDFEAIKQAQTDYRAWIAADPVAAVRAKMSRGPQSRWDNFKAVVADGRVAKSLQEFADEVYRGVVDHLNPWKRAVEELAKLHYRNKGITLDLHAGNDPWKILRMAPNSAAAGQMDLMHGVHLYHEVNPTGPSLASAMEMALGARAFRKWVEGDADDPAAAQTINNFGDYLISKRAAYLHRRAMAGKGPPPDDLPVEVHEANVAALEAANPTFAPASDMVYEYANTLMKKAFQAGFIAPEVYNKILAESQFYVPMYRDISDRGQAGGARGSAGKGGVGPRKLKGSDRAYLNPIQSLMQRTYEVNSAIVRNDALKALDAIGKAAGPDSAAFVVRPKPNEIQATRVDVLDAVDALAKQHRLDEADRDSLRIAMETAFGSDPFVKVYTSKDLTPRPGENIVWMWENGRAVPLQLADGKMGQHMIEALANLDPPQMNAFIETLAVPAKLLRWGITAHPTFFAANWIRDQFSAFVLTDVGYRPGVDNLRGIGNEAVGTDLTRRYSVMMGHSGGMETANAARAKGTRDIQALRKKGYRIRQIASWQGLSRFTEISETGTRLGIFAKAEEKAAKEGRNAWDAAKEGAYEARDFIDFQRVGAWQGVRALTRIIPFFNAAIQSIDKGARVGIEPLPELVRLMAAGKRLTPAQQKTMNLFIRSWTAGALLATGSLMLRAAYEDDPEWSEAADYLRATHWVVRIPGTDMFAAIPKPYQEATLANAAERAFEAVKMQDPTAAGRFAAGLGQVFLPPIDAPALFLPGELLANKDSFGMDIVPAGKEGVEARDQYSERTNRVVAETADMLWEATGGAVKVSPAMAEHAIKGVFGSFGGDVLALGANRAPIEGKASETWFLRRFAKDWHKGSTSTKEFFRLVGSQSGKFERAALSINRLALAGDAETVMRRMNAMPPAQRAYVRAWVFDRGIQKQRHPLVNATLASREVMELAGDLRQQDVLLNTGGMEPVRLTKAQRRDAVDALGALAVAMRQNALIETGAPGWAGTREPISQQKYARALYQASPEVAQALFQRMAVSKVIPPMQAGQYWTAARAQLEAPLTLPEVEALVTVKVGRASGRRERALKAPVPAEAAVR